MPRDQTAPLTTDQFNTLYTHMHVRKREIVAMLDRATMAGEIAYLRNEYARILDAIAAVDNIWESYRS